MGVTRLLQVLKSVTKKTHLSHYAGTVIGIDGYSWLHKSVLLCATDLALGNPTFKYVDYFESRIRLLRSANIEPYFVFDGDALPTKSCVEKSRSSNRQIAREKGFQLYKSGMFKQAAEQFQKCVDITPKMTAAVIDLLDRFKVKYVVAPYEADAQLVYLEKTNQIHAIISEDSDLLVFGAKVLLTKMNSAGEFMEVRRDRFNECTDICLTEFTDADLRLMAVLSGCDYSSGLPGIGLTKANALIRKYRTYDRIERALRLEGTVKIPSDFKNIYEQADLTFLHQRVFCPHTQSVVMLNPVDENTPITIEGFSEFIGKEKDPHISIQISKGRMDPMTHEIIRFPVLPAFKTYSLPSIPASIRTIDSFFKVASNPLHVKPDPSPASPITEPTSALVKRKFKSFIGSDDDIDESHVSNFFKTSENLTPKTSGIRKSSPSGIWSTSRKDANSVYFWEDEETPVKKQSIIQLERTPLTDRTNVTNNQLKTPTISQSMTPMTNQSRGTSADKLRRLESFAFSSSVKLRSRPQLSSQRASTPSRTSSLKDFITPKASIE